MLKHLLVLICVIIIVQSTISGTNYLITRDPKLTVYAYKNCNLTGTDYQIWYNHMELNQRIVDGIYFCTPFQVSPDMVRNAFMRIPRTFYNQKNYTQHIQQSVCLDEAGIPNKDLFIVPTCMLYQEYVTNSNNDKTQIYAYRTAGLFQRHRIPFFIKKNHKIPGNGALQEIDWFKQFDKSCLYHGKTSGTDECIQRFNLNNEDAEYVVFCCCGTDKCNFKKPRCSKMVINNFPTSTEVSPLDESYKDDKYCSVELSLEKEANSDFIKFKLVLSSVGSTDEMKDYPGGVPYCATNEKDGITTIDDKIKATCYCDSAEGSKAPCNVLQVHEYLNVEHFDSGRKGFERKCNDSLLLSVINKGYCYKYEQIEILNDGKVNIIDLDSHHFAKTMDITYLRTIMNTNFKIFIDGDGTRDVIYATAIIKNKDDKKHNGVSLIRGKRCLSERHFCDLSFENIDDVTKKEYYKEIFYCLDGSVAINYNETLSDELAVFDSKIKSIHYTQKKFHFICSISLIFEEEAFRIVATHVNITEYKQQPKPKESCLHWPEIIPKNTEVWPQLHLNEINFNLTCCYHNYDTFTSDIVLNDGRYIHNKCNLMNKNVQDYYLNWHKDTKNRKELTESSLSCAGKRCDKISTGCYGVRHFNSSNFEKEDCTNHIGTYVNHHDEYDESLKLVRSAYHCEILSTPDDYKKCAFVYGIDIMSVVCCCKSFYWDPSGEKITCELPKLHYSVGKKLHEFL